MGELGEIYRAEVVRCLGYGDNPSDIEKFIKEGDLKDFLGWITFDDTLVGSQIKKFIDFSLGSIPNSNGMDELETRLYDYYDAQKNNFDSMATGFVSEYDTAQKRLGMDDSIGTQLVCANEAKKRMNEYPDYKTTVQSMYDNLQSIIGSSAIPEQSKSEILQRLWTACEFCSDGLAYIQEFTASVVQSFLDEKSKVQSFLDGKSNNATDGKNISNNRKRDTDKSSR